jgi:hypothetical protein
LDLKYTIVEIGELHATDFQKNVIGLVVFIGLISAMAGLGVRLRGPILVIFAIILFVGLSYQRGLIMLFLIAPVILARPVAGLAPSLAPQPSGRQPLDAVMARDPVLQYLQNRLLPIQVASAIIAALATIVPWGIRDITLPRSVAPTAAIDFVRRAGITGNVFNDYNFGGFLIFSQIQTFVDGRALPFGDDFLHKYFDAATLVDFDSAFRMLDDYNISWVILSPIRPLTKAIARSPSWDKVYSDEYSVVFVRRP